MNSNIKTDFKCEYEALMELFEEYDYQIMAAKDDAILYVVDEILEHIMTTYQYLKGQSPIKININCAVELIISAEQVFNIVTLLEFVPRSIAKNYKAIRISSKNKGIEFVIMFDYSLSLIVIQNRKKELILDLNEYCVIDNTFNENETYAILFILAFVLLRFSSKEKEKNEECKIIYLSDYRN